MLYRLEIENFYSIRDLQVLDLRVPKNVADFPERFSEIFPGSEERVAKAIALFGPNGSGKSTVLRALAFIGWFLRESFQYQGPSLPCERFNDAGSADRLIRLAVELGSPLDLSGSPGTDAKIATAENVGTFRYELHLQPRDGAIRSVSHEALRLKRRGQGKWQRVFERSGDRAVLGSKTFPLAGFSQVIDKIRENASVVATLALFDHPASKVISTATGAIFGNILIDRIDASDQATVHYLAQNPDVVVELNRELQRIDLGVEGVHIVQTANGPAALFRHQGLHLDMPWSLESHGTRSFIRTFPLILLALQRGGIAIIDELDQSIHPLVLPEIVRWFYDPRRNPLGAQLWMSCHSASLLDDLAKEEVVFCDKDDRGRSQVYSLMDVGAVRRTDNLYKKYLGGVYGAIPQIG
ncbi:AAA family ATPase [Labrys wisconsinensis]|uniref:Energy-coupling factor transporter ATP-binding protein EcfA2 n=1 Tax=Labrys wisconsinensis TaxID=425677 RepID=A0ABU0JBU7_9HYPH|nr:ATP-binding protein [Labrys wisconsinensis]MDQ0471757.1 energy-coupling factor transporter ATP-binding protein EcfA2 [Labrys wisconsinensis]